MRYFLSLFREKTYTKPPYFLLLTMQNILFDSLDQIVHEFTNGELLMMVMREKDKNRRIKIICAVMDKKMKISREEAFGKMLFDGKMAQFIPDFLEGGVDLVDGLLTIDAFLDFNLINRFIAEKQYFLAHLVVARGERFMDTLDEGVLIKIMKILTFREKCQYIEKNKYLPQIMGFSGEKTEIAAYFCKNDQIIARISRFIKKRKNGKCPCSFH